MPVHPPHQDQHKVPQVYLKQFGYQQGNQWKVSVLYRGETFTRQKSIGSFTAATNIFDIDNPNPTIARLFESLNGVLETEYSRLLSELENCSEISERSHFILIQLVPNLICRSDYWRDWIRGFLEHKNRPHFIRDLLAHNTNTYEEYLQLDNTRLFQRLVNAEITESLINEVLLHFTSYLFHHIKYFDVVILESPEGRPWLTSDNPVLFKLTHERDEIIGINSEAYLPLSPRYLAYLHVRTAINRSNPLRQLQCRRVHPVLDVLSEEEFLALVREINENMGSYLILSEYLNYRQE